MQGPAGQLELLTSPNFWMASTVVAVLFCVTCTGFEEPPLSLPPNSFLNMVARLQARGGQAVSEHSSGRLNGKADQRWTGHASNSRFSFLQGTALL
jgi:hypothetical protein